MASQDYQQAKAALKASELGRTHPGFAQHLTAFKQSFCNQRDLRLYKTMRNLGQVAAVPRSRNQRLVKPSGRYSKVHEGITRAAGEIALALPPPRAFLEADAAVQSAGLVDTAALIQRSSGASGGKRGRRQKSAVDADEVDVSAAASAASTAPASPTVRGRGRPRGRPRGSRAPASSRGTGSTGDVISRTESPAPSEASVQSLTSKTRRRRMYGVNGHLIPYVASMLATQEEEQSAAAAAAAEAVERAQEEALLDKAADEAMAAVQQAAAAQTATVEEREEEEVEEAEGEDDEDDEVEYDLAAGVEIYDPDEVRGGVGVLGCCEATVLNVSHCRTRMLHQPQQPRLQNHQPRRRRAAANPCVSCCEDDFAVVSLTVHSASHSRNLANVPHVSQEVSVSQPSQGAPGAPPSQEEKVVNENSNEMRCIQVGVSCVLYTRFHNKAKDMRSIF